MFDQIKAIFSGPREAADAVGEGEETAVALAALMLEAAKADEVRTGDEDALIRRVLIEAFDVADADADALLAEAEKRQSAANDLHQFTKLAKALPDEDRIAFIEALWSIALSDDVRDPYEEAVIRRICGLIYVSDVDSGAARRRVEARL
ncbi:MAG: TerB family tellurite resistance protein [Pseudomonadota bacterium]